MTRKIIPCFLMLGGLLGACVPQEGYYWGEYEPRLYAYYRDPEALEPLMADLESTLATGEATQRVPPGLYAEYGYLLMTKNRHGEAIAYFNKEKSAWPESTVLMDKMIGFANATRN